MLSSLEIALVLLAASVVAVVVLRAFNLPPLVAYLAVGTLLGPHATNLAGDPEAVRHAGELGVVFLMFTLGLEFSLGKLTAMRSMVFGLGSAQVLVTMAIVVALLVAVPAAATVWLLGGAIDWRAALVIGGAVAMSSTAMVTKLLAEKRELESEHGKRVFSVLLFQDLAVIPLLILIPALAQGGDAWIGAVGLATLKAVLLLVLLMRFGPWLMKRWFNVVARQRSHELFTLNVLLATLLFAWLTKMAGLSMELGAFVAGMLISETAFRFQVEEDIKPFRDVLLGLFFVSIGTQLNLRVVAEFATAGAASDGRADAAEVRPDRRPGAAVRCRLGRRDPHRRLAGAGGRVRLRAAGARRRRRAAPRPAHCSRCWPRCFCRC